MGFQNVKRYYLSENKGKKRVWIEGQSLEAAGFSPAVRYARRLAPDGSIILDVTDDGAFVVSKKEKSGRTIPVLDLANKEIDALLADSTAVEVVFRENRIVIKKSEVDRIIGERETRLRERLREKQPLETGSLYHGGGILDSGLHEGFAVAGVPAHLRVAVEIEQEYLETSMRNNSFWADKAYAVCSPMELTLNGNVQKLKLDVLTIGLPCTGASRAGMSKNQLELPEEHKSAGAQFYYALKWIESTAPAVVIVENVPEYQKTASWMTMKAVFKNLGYDVAVREFSGAEFGAIEDRTRMVGVAVSHGIQRVMGFDLDAVRPRKEKPKTLADILDPVPLDSPLWKRPDYLKDKEERDIAAGKGFRLQWLTPETAETIGTIGRGYAKLRGTEPFVRHPENKDLVRILTPREHARVKTIPESAIDGVESTTVAHEILGQSVVREWFVCVGSSLAEGLRRACRENVIRDKEKLPSVSEMDLF